MSRATVEAAYEEREDVDITLKEPTGASHWLESVNYPLKWKADHRELHTTVEKISLEDEAWILSCSMSKVPRL
ncbi:hypothetical protein GOP47_0001328 [Adiantum capillus-veneris]|uniref:Uncharacterized protein n=1 Tax=Adiantum capillus-veneris TaxID=13818 RepID=A0A9D4V815_ADICA|nr:hypothetical protein GOP47_0001328 [Adiantum capillus-veneris]